MLTFCQTEELMEKERDESLDWIESNFPKITAGELRAYKTGFEQGWRGARVAFQQNGYTFPDPKRGDK